jgi:hypothetical protein
MDYQRSLPPTLGEGWGGGKDLGEVKKGNQCKGQKANVEGGKEKEKRKKGNGKWGVKLQIVKSNIKC